MSGAPTNHKRVELVWPGKKTQVERVKLPFQVIERVNDVRRSERGQGHLLGTELPLEWPSNWRNKLIWGDNKYVLSSLADEFAGKMNLIYIDPPFATGADFAFDVEIGDDDIALTKEHSAIEEKAYRDTWGEGLQSYLQTIFERLLLMRELLADDGSIYIHLDWHIVHYVKALADEVFGAGGDQREPGFRSEIIWKSTSAHSDSGRYGSNHQTIVSACVPECVQVFHAVRRRDDIRVRHGHHDGPSERIAALIWFAPDVDPFDLPQVSISKDFHECRRAG
jgi:adenine-specific DNA-methyltransferase